MSDRAIVGIVACGTVAVACWAASSGLPLWGLIPVAWIIAEMPNG